MRKVVLNLFWKWLEFDLCPPFKVTLFANSVIKCFTKYYVFVSVIAFVFVFVLPRVKMNACMPSIFVSVVVFVFVLPWVKMNTKHSNRELVAHLDSLTGIADYTLWIQD